MAKQDKVLPARRHRDRQDDSVLIRSAESLGRVIGTLQRQLDGAAKRLKPGASGAGDDMALTGSDGDGGGGSPGLPTTARAAVTAAADAAGVERPARTTGIRRIARAKTEGTSAATPRRATKKAAAPRRAAAGATKTTTRASAARKPANTAASKAAASTRSARSTTAKTKRQR